MKEHLRPLHSRVIVEGIPTNRVLVDDGVVVNLMPKIVFKKLGKSESDLIPTNMVVTDFNGRTSPSDGVTMLTIQVGTIKRPTLFVVVPSRASYNLLLGRDWIHAVGAIPSTLHQKMILWNDDGFVESIEADDSPCYM